MEQLTPGEWMQEQLKRTPYFAIVTAVMAVFLFVSTLIEYSAARQQPDFTPLRADIIPEKLELPPIKDPVKLDKPEMKPNPNLPPIPDQEVASNVDAPIENTDLDVEFTEDSTSDAAVATDPFPVDMTKRLAVIGTEPGTGGFRGALGNRTPGGRRRAAGRFGAPRGTDQSILAALRWLKSVQEADGSWDAAKWGGNAASCSKDGATGMALLAFLGYGCTDKEPTEFAPTVKKAVEFLTKAQATDGRFAGRMYEQGICTLAMAEAYGMMNYSKIKESAQKGLDYILSKQPSSGGFGYNGPPDDPGKEAGDMSVTGFQMQALKGAISVGLRVPNEARDRAEAFLKQSLNKNYSCSYRVPAPPAPPAESGGTVPMTAANLTARLFLGHTNTSPDCVGQAKWLADNKHLDWAQPQQKNLYAVYYLSLAMFNMGGDYWKDWNKAFNEPLRAGQEKDGATKGSWPPEACAYGGTGGRIYTTALACLSLEVYWRYDRPSR